MKLRYIDAVRSSSYRMKKEFNQRSCWYNGTDCHELFSRQPCRYWLGGSFGVTQKDTQATATRHRREGAGAQAVSDERSATTDHSRRMFSRTHP